MLPELLIVFSLSSVDADPALSHDIYVNELSRGEYYLHVEAAQANMHPDQPTKVDSTWNGGIYQDEGMALFEVQVNFETSSIRLAKDELDATERYLNSGTAATYVSDRSVIGEMSADEVMDYYDVQGGTVLAISREANQGLWLEVDRTRPGDIAAMQVIYKQVDDKRVLTIRGRVLFEETTVDELKSKVESLVETYRDYPRRRYTGAVVE